jgi:uncharacterized paraquat-inducible protein A
MLISFIIHDIPENVLPITITMLEGGFLSKTLLKQRFLLVKMKSTIHKNVTTARVPCGKVEVIIKQKRYYSKSY